MKGSKRIEDVEKKKAFYFVKCRKERNSATVKEKKKCVRLCFSVRDLCVCVCVCERERVCV